MPPCMGRRPEAEERTGGHIADEVDSGEAVEEEDNGGPELVDDLRRANISPHPSICCLSCNSLSFVVIRRIRRRRVSITQVAFVFEFSNESCTSDDGIIRVYGALHAEALPNAYELMLLAYPAFRALTACRASARSQLEADRRRYAASEDELCGCRSPTCAARVGGHASEVGGGVQRRVRCVMCMPCVWVTAVAHRPMSWADVPRFGLVCAQPSYNAV